MDFDQIETYFNDRAKELEYEVPLGTATVFVNALTLLKIVGDLAKDHPKQMPFLRQYMPELYKYDLIALHNNLSNYFAVNTPTVPSRAYSLTHQSNMNYKVVESDEGDKYTCLSADAFVAATQKAVKTFFEEARKDTAMMCLVLARVNINKPVGCGAVFRI